jgi:hypothetical protein
LPQHPKLQIAIYSSNQHQAIVEILFPTSEPNTLHSTMATHQEQHQIDVVVGGGCFDVRT